jgi:acyl carrier protein phosphodiesterase
MNCSFVGMNFLAHAYLSFNDPEILVGNMVSDFVKGSARFGFSGKIQKGIMLHREIDSFTDVHPATKEAKQIFRPAYRLYSGAIMDVIYDHFLATDPDIFDERSLKLFTHNTYIQLEQNAPSLPNNFIHVLSFMKMEDWLFHYRFKEGISKSLKGLVRRAVYLSESDTAFRLFQDEYSTLQSCYEEFFPDVKEFAKERFELLK